MPRSGLALLSYATTERATQCWARFARISSHSAVSRKASCGIKVQRGGRKTLRPFEFFQIMFRSLRHERSADGSAVMSADTFACRDHTRVHDIRPIFTYSTPIKSFYLPCYPPTSKECTYQSFTDCRLVAFCYSRCLIQDFSHLPLRYGPTSCI